MHRTTILVVKNDPSAIELVRVCLEKEGWKTLSASNGDDAIRLVREDPPDLVILDAMMPGISGIDVCRHITATSAVPVVMLSARADLDDKLTCLGLGADDYITEPFQPEELIARAKVALRNHQDNPLSTLSSFSSGGLELDFDAKQVRINGDGVKVTTTEYRLLEELAQNAGKALTYRYLLHEVWGPEYSEEKQYLHLHIGRLRAKIEPDPNNPSYIVTVPGIGYRFEKLPDK